MTQKNKVTRVEVKLTGKFERDVSSYAKEFGYSKFQELFKDALREKIYGKSIKEQITNEFMKQIEEEKEYLFDERKEIHEKLKKIVNNF